MKSSRKLVALVLVCIMLFSAMLSGCGQKESDITTVSNDSGAGVSDNSQKADDQTTDNGKTNLANGEKKKIYIVMEDSFDDRVKVKENFLKTLKDKANLDSSTADITELNTNGDQNKIQEYIDKIKNDKPDVVVVIPANTGSEIINPLEGSNIPVLVYTAAENYTDSNGNPKDNVTGVTTMKSDLRYSAFSLLNKISPINGKKAVFVTVDGYFTKDDIQSNLQKLNIELKDYCESKYVEDFMAAVNQYNNDDEVGWILVGVAPAVRKDGAAYSQVQMINWIVENLKKPTVTYWDIGVQMGILCGLGIDLTDTGNQLGDMAIKILSGEKVQNIKAEEPQKTNIVLNQKTADQLGIKFPVDVLGAAFKVYTDYQGNYKK